MSDFVRDPRRVLAVFRAISDSLLAYVAKIGPVADDEADEIAA
jgi:hypothetical protein